MKLAVWDTYVKKRDGNVMHFDIIVPEEVTSKEKIFEFGRAYLDSKNEREAKLESEECQFCHIEEANEEMISSINTKGYYILEMEEIPAALPENPSRRDLILHLRAFYPPHRFANFKGKSEDEVKALLNS